MKLRFGLPVLTSLLLASSIFANPIVLKFENIVPGGTQSALILDFYHGGGGAANDFGIDFSDNALAVCLNLSGQTCSNASRGGLGDADSQAGGLFFLTGSVTFMNDSAGFDTGFSLFYSAVNSPGSLSVYDGLNGTGNVLATLDLPLTSGAVCPAGNYNAGFCPFVPVGVSFAGTAKSIGFAGVANQIVFDDVTFGSVTPGAGGDVPEPATVGLTCVGLGLVALRIRRRNQSQA